MPLGQTARLLRAARDHNYHSHLDDEALTISQLASGTDAAALIDSFRPPMMPSENHASGSRPRRRAP